MKTFIPDLELSELFYKGAVKPLRELHFLQKFHRLPRLSVVVGEVLGFDTPSSTHHHRRLLISAVFT